LILLAVIDYDRVLVLKNGAIVENDSPAALIIKDDSEFKRLCMADGPTEYQHLLAMARSGKD
jgi:ABC-type multidrug transport system fused ATPase/permease subunit